MMNNGTVQIEVTGHSFEVEVHDNYWELHVGKVTDSRCWVCYQGPLKKPDQLSEEIQQFTRDRPGVPVVWRKCKTVLKISSRCNEEVWNAAGEKELPAVRLYRSELCRAHVPVVNRLVQQYRLATYDYFAYEVAPWDIPRWGIERDGHYVASMLVPYREWDFKPLIFPKPDAAPTIYQLIEAADLQKQISAVASAGEHELLDALNLMERGDYSGAVRRVTTSIEVLVEDVVRAEIEARDGRQAADSFLEDTKTRFERRVQKYEQLSNRTMLDGMRRDLSATRTLRHRIVHGGYRLGPHERGRAQRSVDTGRWIFDWFENDSTRKKIRESKIAYRSLGRDLYAGIFSPEITPDGVALSPLNL